MTHPSAPANRLAQETSPYLLQHARNPVDWLPWGPEALERSRRENKPIFLSIGYSACHWCHVMAHESFEDPETAKAMNAHYVCVKVDREERPDLDEIYMQSVIAMTGSGGWPMSVWLTPDQKPFYGGTYFPPTARHGLPAFRTVLEGVARAWRERPGEIAKAGDALTDAIRQQTVLEEPAGGLDRKAVTGAVEALKAHFDPEFAGFGGAPKFPPSMDLNLLLREHRRSGDAVLLAMVEGTLDRMAQGGIYDQLGGGFHRYATDGQWRVPHFEKMLYDNALLVRSYLQAWQVTGRAEHARIAREVCEYVLREMTSPEGAFFSAQDADSEGEEGRFFVWTPEEIQAALGKEDGERFCRTYDVTGNFEQGRSVLWLPQPVRDAALRERLDGMRGRLLAARGRRVRPGLDSKILADWNGLMVRALAEAGWALDEPRYLEAARKAAGFCLTRMRAGGRLMHAFGGGRARLTAYLDDHAFLAAGCLALFEATGEGRWLKASRELADLMRERFEDGEKGAFFYTADDHEALIARTKHPGDNALPSGNSVAAGVLLRLAALTGEPAYRESAEGTLRAFAPRYVRQPRGFAEMLCALDLAASPLREVVVVGPPADRRPLLDVLRRRFLPDAVVAAGEAGSPVSPLFEGKGLVGGKAAAYVCSGGACRAPVTDPEELGRLLDAKPASAVQRGR